MITDTGGRYVDGGIIGLPPAAPGSTRLYLSGPDAPTIQALFEGTDLDARIAGKALTAASAVKMAYGAWTKGTAALILAVRELAREEGVEDTLLAEWALSQPKLEERSQGSARSAEAKGWRWVAEMEEIAATMAAAGLPGRLPPGRRRDLPPLPPFRLGGQHPDRALNTKALTRASRTAEGDGAGTGRRRFRAGRPLPATSPTGPAGISTGPGTPTNRVSSRTIVRPNNFPGRRWRPAPAASSRARAPSPPGRRAMSKSTVTQYGVPISSWRR